LKKKKALRWNLRVEIEAEVVPLWGIPVFFSYAMRRVDCLSCGVRVELVPWAEGKNI